MKLKYIKIKYVQSNFIWFLGLYISGSTNPRSLVFYKLKFL